jgi:hypothetical protein
MREQRQQQLLLLQQIVWQLPLVLLHVAQLYGGEHALVTSAAAEAAWCCCSCWLLLAKQPDDAAIWDVRNVRRSYTKRFPEQWLEQLTPVLPLLQDSWLQLMQRQLLQGPDGGMLQQHVQVQSEVLRLRRCVCLPSSPGVHEWRAVATVTVDCGWADSISALLALLEPLSYFGPVSVWEGKLPAVLLLLELLLRKLAPPVLAAAAAAALALMGSAVAVAVAWGVNSCSYIA